MNQRIRDLCELSTLDTALRDLAKRRDARRQAVSAAEAALAAAEAGLTSKRDEIRTLQKEADALNLDIRSSEEHIAKLETQRNAAKSNKEYEVFTREIDAAKEKVGGIEDEVLARLEGIDELTEQQREFHRKVEDGKAALTEAREQLADVERVLSSEETELMAERDGLAARIDPDDLTLYDRILEMRKDCATSAVENGTCRACARRLTPQLENLVAIGDDIVQCMSCSRILYVDEDAGGP